MNIETEIWKPVVGYEEQYEVSMNGLIKTIDKMIVTEKGLVIKKGKVLKSRINNFGYVEVRLYQNGRQKTTFIHILIANAFLPNPENKPEVNHLNGIKTDNSIENLEWCTRLENMQHAKSLGLLKRKFKEVIDLCSGKKYKSISEAARELNINYTTCKNYLNGNRPNKTCLEYSS